MNRAEKPLELSPNLKMENDIIIDENNVVIAYYNRRYDDFTLSYNFVIECIIGNKTIQTGRCGSRIVKDLECAGEEEGYVVRGLFIDFFFSNQNIVKEKMKGVYIDASEYHESLYIDFGGFVLELVDDDGVCTSCIAKGFQGKYFDPCEYFDPRLHSDDNDWGN